MSESPEILTILKYIKHTQMRKRWFWVSIRKAKNCLFSRRNGYVGKVICGYSVCLRLFNINVL